MGKIADAILTNEVDDISRTIETVVNVLLFKPIVEIEDILKEKQCVEFMNAFSIAWLNVLKKQKMKELYDGRNEYSVNIGSKIYDKIKETNLINLTTMQPVTRYDGTNLNVLLQLEPDLASQVAFRLSNTHRTLQQTISELVFVYMKENLLSKEQIVEYNKEIGYYKWEECPLI